MTLRPLSRRLLSLSVLPLLALGACAQTPPPPPPPPAPASGFSAGIEVTEEVGPAQLGMPVYPGAQPQRDSAEDKSAVNLSMWGGRFGVQLAAAKYQSRDDVDRVARFYREALNRYGDLLDCGDPRAPQDKPKAGGPLTCDGDKPEAGGQLFKVGVPKNFRVVSIRRLDARTTQISLARVALR
ncbi:hypothetical protein [Roseateles amylovorans]|uniref:Uncharacterized protein n=1 Tax=Roseateles amylovorans TaxID=2978473 RepID=A0ABY6B1C6_9BURK|nr:hypothetical protein [Roseateles amylovorans]UXH78968.1 hypothetical protein N4261_03250 [Roseateles amylovorans]